MPSHDENVVDQFTRQAVPFSTAEPIRDEAALDRIVGASGAGPDDEVLDVACGPGLVACAFARRCRHVTGIDLTPAMLERARVVARENGIANLTWRHGNVQPLPFADGAFSIVVSRFAFHHFQTPGEVLREMRRVCRPGGRVVVVDLLASPDPVKARAFHEMEILRDPSHARALPLEELRGLFREAGLAAPEESFYDMVLELEAYLERSFPAPGDVARIRRMFEDAVADDRLGLRVRRRGDRILFQLAVAILVSPIPESAAVTG
jgi:ubiquinone/menaquinone biosynthesis C-methylase UbiE